MGGQGQTDEEEDEKLLDVCLEEMRPECCASRDVQLSDNVGVCELSFLFVRERAGRNDIGEGWGKVRPGSATDCRRDASPLGCTAPGCAISVGL